MGFNSAFKGLNRICEIKAFAIHWFSKLLYGVLKNHVLTAKRNDKVSLGASCINSNKV